MADYQAEHDWRQRITALAQRALRLPDRQIPAQCHRMLVLLTALIALEAHARPITPNEYGNSVEPFHVTMPDADLEHFALARFASSLHRLGADRSTAFEEVIAAQLAQLRPP